MSQVLAPGQNIRINQGETWVNLGFMSFFTKAAVMPFRNGPRDA